MTLEKIPLVVPLLFVSASVEDAAPTKVVLIYNALLKESSIPETTDFTLEGKTIFLVEVSRKTVTITVTEAFVFEDVITISYTKGTNPIQEAICSLNAADLVDEEVTNNVAAPEYPAILDDGHHWWYDATDLAEITKDGSNFVSAWDSKLISHPLLQETGSNQPLWQSPGTILFDGIDNFLRTVAFTWDQPNKIYFIGKQIGWTQGDVIYEGITTYYGGLRQYNHSPRVRLSYPPGFYTVQNDDWILDIYAIVRTLNYSTDSYIQINDDAPVVADNKAYNMGGFTLGRAGSSSIGYGNFVVADIICADIVDTEENETAIYDFLVSRIPA